MVVSKDKLWATGHDETVEVNQRALIDKVLARYSGEFTVFRELLQNSDDAQSEAVEIRFETQEYLASKAKEQSGEHTEAVSSSRGPLPDLRTTHVHQWTFKNNGIVFREEDWSRLKKIGEFAQNTSGYMKLTFLLAEGNPDEEKIGAFGVGFYSLFSVTEEPFVTSGDQWMGFHWKDKKDQLFARRGQLPNAEGEEDPASRKWTSFAMALREPAPIPIAFDFTRFLVSSLTFMRTLKEVSVYFDDKRLVKLNKAAGQPRNLGIPKGLNTRSHSGIMIVDGIQTTPLYIKAQVMKWIYTSGTEKKRIAPPKVVAATKPSGGGSFFSSLFSSFGGTSTPQRAATPAPLPPPKPVDHLAINETSVSLSIYSASVQVRLDKKLSSEINRSTKKNPPTKMKFELIYTAKDEYDASLEEDAKQPEATGSIFQGLRADVDGTGAARVFIGHSTAQSTGIGGHIAARFIPTVERESIDFMDRNVAIWNKELLYVGGFLSRATYEFELSTVREQWEASSAGLSPPPLEIQERLRARVIHALQFFMFYTSTPSSDVSSLMEAAFFSCSSDGHFPIVTSKGIRDIKDVRLPDPTFSGFLKDLPTLPDEVMAGAPGIISALQARGLIKAIDFQDVLKELQSRPLTEGEFVACLNWWIEIFKESDRSRLLPIRSQVINAIVISVAQENGSNPRIIPLASIRSFINPRSPAGNIPLEAPLPESLLPVSVSKLFKPDVLLACFPWTELSLVQWLSFICSTPKLPVEYDIAASPIWSERILALITRSWPTLTASSKAEIVQILRIKTCIPTSAGLKLPHEAYFPNVNIFGDLPVVVFQSGTVIKGTLEKVLQELGVRKHVELQIIFNRMIKTNEWTIADLTKYLVSVKDSLTPEEMTRLRATAAFPTELKQEDIPGEKRIRYKAGQLYEPLEVFRTLGLPIIDWGQHTKWRSSSEEAKFLFNLGLQRFPPLAKVIELCTDNDSNIRTAALKYLIENIDSKYQDYDPMNFKDTRFIPAMKGSTACLGNIQEVFSAPWAAVGFMILQPSYQIHASKLKIKDHPPASQLLYLLQTKPPSSEEEAANLFRLLAGRVNDFKSSDLQRLSSISFVPIKAEKGAVGPTVRWLPPTQCYLAGQGGAAFHSKLFVFVDFGTSANAFLTACGTRSQPSVEEVAKILLNNPLQFYELAQGPVNFLAELRNLAVNVKSISSNTILRMKRSPVLLGLQRKPKKQTKSTDDWDEDEWDIVYELKKPSNIIIADDTHSYQVFGDSFFTAPQEDIIEAFYISLGSQQLSRVVREEYQTTGELHDSKPASETRALILERLPLFLHEHTHAATQVSFSWLSSNRNFVVRAFGKLGVVKYLNYGQLNLSRKQDASAVARRTGSGPIELWIAGNSQVDMYEVATSLNRLIFGSPKANDALLFMTILSTDLRSLKRRGYNVDRILRQQRDARLAAESARIAKEQEEARHKLPGSFEPEKTIGPRELNQDQQTLVAEPRGPSPPPLGNTFQNLRRKLASVASAQTEKLSNLANQPSTKSGIQPPDDHPGPSMQPQIMSPPDRNGYTPTPMGGSNDNSGVTPLSNISRNIDLAVNSCRPESGDLLQNREHMQRVTESVNDGYCDISGKKGDLRNIGQMGPVKIYLSEEVKTQPDSFMEVKNRPIARFIHIMTPLANVYELPITNLHIFYDLQGGIIAFNRNGSIFLNLRYFEEWHDADVQGNNLQEAYISWYFTIAHEIAHNLVQPHNSEHEFYFSAICERYLVQLARLISSTPRAFDASRQ